ncbi:MAG TPA: glycosyltransferase, partial [Chthoniobacterales bacterium]
FSAELANGVIPASWGDPFRWFLDLTKIPKVAICHGTPAFEGQYGLDPARKHEFIIYEDRRRALVERLASAGVSVVCNSWHALEEWGFKNSRVIWHGFDPQEFPPGTYRRDVLCLDADPYRPHYRGAWELAMVRERLNPEIRVETARHFGAPLEVRDTNPFAVRNFRSYVDRIRQFKVYLNTTLRSPMPRSRGEAMMTGVIPVCLNNHDVARFIVQGENGFFADDPGELADYVNYLCGNQSAAARIGAQARRTALEVFNHDLYLANWARQLGELAR